ncbi:uncharacterized protein EI90DRAFT_556186 [Cantharellus anzutake]|uniref:uncharacterized protein n=1 Tax=Cantharellus anzutake TaxID=1750568 RepID=UPI001905B506|nr:uncharacterized protein EI90DRAFT_556186 [Cantharellus anzutake]KAF8313362.1 hypothetical protein EI90DRAFT_556186 [Cantharellus anzutake]
MLRMFRLIFILALFFAKNFANPIDPALPIPDRRDTSPAHGPFGTLKGLPLLTAEPSSTHDGAGSGGLGAAASCPGYHLCPDGRYCTIGTYCHGGYCFPTGTTPCGTGHYCCQGFRCYKNIACFPKGATPCGGGNHFCWPGGRCCNHGKSCCY